MSEPFTHPSPAAFTAARAHLRGGQYSPLTEATAALAHSFDAFAARTPALPPSPPPGFVRVRGVAVASPAGDYSASGNSDSDFEDNKRTALDCCPGAGDGTGFAVVPFVLDIPLPQPAPEIVALVEPRVGGGE